MATGSVSPKRGKIVNIPDQTVTIGTATDGGTGSTVSVAFTAGSVTTGGPVTYYTATSTPGSFTANGTTSPITVSGLSEGTAYTFKVKAGNPTGYSTAGESAASNSITPALPGAFESIATVTSTGSQTELTFTSIPGTYKSLQIRGTFDYTMSGTGIMAVFNSDTGGNYVRHSVTGSSTTLEILGYISQTNARMLGSSYTDTNAANAIISDIYDYASTTNNKVIRSHGGWAYGPSTGAVTQLFSSAWFSTNAITSITLKYPGNTFKSGATFALYGIKG